MRVIGGSLKGRGLTAPAGRGLRPTSDRIRESIFDLLGPVPPLGPVLDLYAGTGALGIEALSRGFSPAVFVDHDPSAREFLQKNLQRCRLEAQARIMATKVARFLAGNRPPVPYALVLMDPPYRKGLVEPALGRLGEGGWLAAEGTLVCEAESGLDLPAQIGEFGLEKKRRYGDTELYLFGRV